MGHWIARLGLFNRNILSLNTHNINYSSIFIIWSVNIFKNPTWNIRHNQNHRRGRDKQRVIMELKAPNIFRILMMDIKKRGIKRRVSVSNSRAALQKKRLGPLCCFKFLGPQFDPHLLSPILSAYSPKAECAISIIPTNTINEIMNYDEVIYLSRSRSRSYWNMATYPNSYSKAQRVRSRVLFPNIWKQLNPKSKFDMNKKE